ncbi:unnamed protein product, partial [Prorocentrum cordatum]
RGLPGPGAAAHRGGPPAEAAEELPALAGRLRAELVACIAEGTLSQSVAPDWGQKGSPFQLLEWVGDSVLHMFLTQQIMLLFGAAGADEGQMSSVRSICGSTRTLARVFRSLDLARLLRHPGGPSAAPNYLTDEKKGADVVEAILGELFEAVKGAAAPGGRALPQASGALLGLLELAFRTGVQETPQRFRPAVTETTLLRVALGHPGASPRQGGAEEHAADAARAAAAPAGGGAGAAAGAAPAAEATADGAQASGAAADAAATDRGGAAAAAADSAGATGAACGAAASEDGGASAAQAPAPGPRGAPVDGKDVEDISDEEFLPAA